MREKIKSLASKNLPPWVWKVLFNISRRSYIFGIIFNVIIRRYKSYGCRFNIAPSFPLPERSQFIFNTYERGEQQAVMNYIRQDDSVLELGGCQGIVTLA
jgi:hypothetical protein